MKIRLSLLMLAVAAVSVGPALGDTPLRELTHNPFSRPPSQVPRDSGARVLPDGSVQAIELRATLVAGGLGLANVAGRILRPGDDVSGYTLTRVYEDRAVFVQAGRELTVYVKPGLADDDD